jgi:hypothetical protein
VTGRLFRISVVATYLLCFWAEVTLAQSDAGGGTATADIVSAPDRPNASATADVTQRGVLELEYGFSRQWFGAGSNSNILGSKFRLGVTDNLDFSWSADNLVVRSGASHGFGDTILSARYRFLRQSNLTPSMAFAYRIKLPTARSGDLGTGYTDHQFAFLASKDFGLHHLDFNLVRTLCGAEGGATDYTGISAAYSRPLKGKLLGLIEYSGTVRPESTGTGTAVVAYRVTPRLVLDAGMDFGLTDGVPRRRLVVGMTYALGRLFPRIATLRGEREHAVLDVKSRP